MHMPIECMKRMVPNAIYGNLSTEPEFDVFLGLQPKILVKDYDHQMMVVDEERTQSEEKNPSIETYTMEEYEYILENLTINEDSSYIMEEIARNVGEFLVHLKTSVFAKEPGCVNHLIVEDLSPLDGNKLRIIYFYVNRRDCTLNDKYILANHVSWDPVTNLASVTTSCRKR